MSEKIIRLANLFSTVDKNTSCEDLKSQVALTIIAMIALFAAMVLIVLQEGFGLECGVYIWLFSAIGLLSAFFGFVPIMAHIAINED